MLRPFLSPASRSLILWSPCSLNLSTWVFKTSLLVQPCKQYWKKYLLLLSLWYCLNSAAAFHWYVMIFFTSSDIYNKFTLCLAIRNRKIFLSSYPKTLKPKLFLVFKFTNVFYVYEVLDFQKCLTHIHIHDILKFWSNDFRAVLDKTTLGWTTENISCHCFEYWDIHLLLWILLVMVNNQKLSLDRISPALKHKTKHSDKTLRNFIKS